MEEYNIYKVNDVGEREVIKSFKDAFNFKKAIAEFLNQRLVVEKKAERGVDVILRRAFLENTLILSAHFKKLKKALRHFDEIGLCNDIYDFLEEGTDASALSFCQERFDFNLATPSNFESIEI